MKKVIYYACKLDLKDTIIPRLRVYKSKLDFLNIHVSEMDDCMCEPVAITFNIVKKKKVSKNAKS
jgi:hypothetical protein